MENEMSMQEVIEQAGWTKVKGTVVTADFPSDILVTPKDCDEDYWCKDESVFAKTVEEAFKLEKNHIVDANKMV